VQFVYEPIKTLIECCMADNREKLWKLTDSLGVTPKLKSCVPALASAYTTWLTVPLSARPVMCALHYPRSSLIP